MDGALTILVKHKVLIGMTILVCSSAYLFRENIGLLVFILFAFPMLMIFYIATRAVKRFALQHSELRPLYWGINWTIICTVLIGIGRVTVTVTGGALVNWMTGIILATLVVNHTYRAILGSEWRPENMAHVRKLVAKAKVDAVKQQNGLSLDFYLVDRYELPEPVRSCARMSLWFTSVALVYMLSFLCLVLLLNVTWSSDNPVRVCINLSIIVATLMAWARMAHLLLMLRDHARKDTMRYITEDEVDMAS